MMAATMHSEPVMKKEKSSKLKRVAAAFAKAVKAATKEREVAQPECEPKSLARPVSVASTCVPDDEDEQQEARQHPTVVDSEAEMGDLAKEYTDPKWPAHKPAERVRRFPSEAYWLHKKRQEDRKPRSGISATNHQVKDRDQKPPAQSPKLRSLWSRRPRKMGANATPLAPRAEENCRDTAASQPQAGAAPQKPAGPPPARQFARPGRSGGRASSGVEAAPAAACAPKEPAAGTPTAAAAAPQKPAGPPPTRQFARPGCPGRQTTRGVDAAPHAAPCPAEPAASTPPAAAAAAPQKPAGPPPARKFARPGHPGVQQITRGKESGLVFGAPDAGAGGLAMASARGRAAVAAAVAAGAAAGASDHGDISQVSESLAGSAGLSLALSARRRQ